MVVTVLERSDPGVLRALICAGPQAGQPAVEEYLYALDCYAQENGLTLAGRAKWQPAGTAGALEVSCCLLPPVQLPPYKGLRVEYPAPAVPDQTERQLDTLRAQHSTQTETFEAAQPGDVVEVDYDAALDDGFRFGGSLCRGGRFVLGDGQQPAELSRCLAGLCPGQGFTCRVVLPAAYPDRRAAGKAAVYTGTLRRVFRQVVPAADDAFAQELGFPGIQALRGQLAASQQKAAENRGRRAAGQRLLKQLADQAQLELPALAVELEAERSLRQLYQRLQKSHITLQQHLARLRKTEQALHDDLRRYAGQDLRERIVFLAIAQAEGLTVTDDELARAAGAAARQGIQRPDRMQLRQRLTAQKASELVLDHTEFIPMASPPERISL